MSRQLSQEAARHLHHLHLLPRECDVTEPQLEALLTMLDDLHNAASDGTLGALTTVSKYELIGWLHELIYTASETLVEIERDSAGQQNFPPALTVVRRASDGEGSRQS